MTQLLSVADAAARLSCSRGHIYNLIATGQLAAVEIATKGSGRPKTRVREADLETFIAEHARVA